MSTVKGYKPHEKQRLLHNEINNSSAKYYTLCIGRQFGKTLLCINQLLYWSINDKGSRIAWVSPIWKQSKKVYQELKRATESSGYFDYHDTDLVIKGFGSEIMFFSGEKPDNIRGNTFDYLVIDEFAFTRSELWSEVLSATVLVKGKKVVFISTPKGKNHFYQMFLQSNYDDRYKSFRFTSYDNPMIDHQDLEERRRALPEHIFKQEYLAEFLDDVSGLFRNVRDCINKRRAEGSLYAGLDIGRADDYTVLTVGDKDGNVKDVYRWRHSEWSKIIGEVAQKIKEHKCVTYVEVNNQGDVFYEMLQREVKNYVHPFVTTSKSKPLMVEALAVEFEQMSISIPNEEFLIDELEAFTYIYDPKSRRVKYSAPEGVHDDTVISLGLYNLARKELSKKGKYFIVK